ncbi:tripartite motif-containing protein 2-like [Pecten maximus]|uniref:tripartite motif-containing protein 2-like n=1 Tax=Pecten maximus TaxID=6579 RepID=UPI001458F268|nr:tripartite motif-containing protein 2-like [Pecten maximus]
MKKWKSPYYISSICPTSDGEAWTSDYSETLTLLDRKGTVIQMVTHKAVINDISLSPTSHRLWVCDSRNNIMKLASTGQLTHRFRTKKLPKCICVAACSDVIVGMVKHISKFTTRGQMMLSTMTAGTGKPLVCTPHRITECPVTHNVAVIDFNDRDDGGDGNKHVVVMDKDFKELFVYRGDILTTYKQTPKTGGKPFYPQSVVYDSVGNLIIGDSDNNRVLLLSGGGEFLRIIHTAREGTWAVSVDKEGVIWAVFSGVKVKLLQYSSM